MHEWKDEDEMTHHHHPLRCNHFPQKWCEETRRKCSILYSSVSSWAGCMCAVRVCVKPALTYFILDAEQTHCMIKRPQARGNVNMPTRMTSGREQEASVKIFAELLLWNMLPTSKLRTFWIRLIGPNLAKSCGLGACFMNGGPGLASGIFAADFLRAWFSPLIHFPLNGRPQVQGRKIFQLWNTKRDCCCLFFNC